MTIWLIIGQMFIAIIIALFFRVALDVLGIADGHPFWNFAVGLTTSFLFAMIVSLEACAV